MLCRPSPLGLVEDSVYCWKLPNAALAYEEPEFNGLFASFWNTKLPAKVEVAPSLSDANTTANKRGRPDLSDAMMKSVAAFARNGDPNNAALGVTWPTWPQKLIFDATLISKLISVQ